MKSIHTTSNSELTSLLRHAIRIEATALLEFAEELPESMVQAINLVNQKSSARLVCTGMGKSGHIASKICATLVSTGTPSQFLHPAEAIHGDLGMILKEDILLAFSNSGETEEIVKLIPFFKENNNAIISIVGAPDSTLAKHSDVCIAYSVEREACPHNLAPTSTTTLSLAIGDALAIGLMQGKSFSPIDFARFHPGGSLGRKLLGRVCDYLSPCPSIIPEEPLMNVIRDIISSRAMLGAVVSNGQVVGAITLGDLVRKFSSLNGKIESLACLKALDCMSLSPAIISHVTVCSKADQIMADLRVNSLIVVNDDGFPMGLYTS